MRIVQCAMVVVAAALGFLITSALAQGTGYSLQSTAINVNDLLAPWMPILMMAFMGVALAILELIRQWIKARTGVVISDAHMRTIQAALENAAGKSLMILSDKAKNAQLDVHNPAIKQAIEYVNQSAADAVNYFGLTREQIAEKVIAKIGVITAPNPEVNPRDITPPPPDPGAGG